MICVTITSIVLFAMMACCAEMSILTQKRYPVTGNGYCGGLKPVSLDWSYFGGECYIQNLTGYGSTISCASVTINPISQFKGISTVVLNLVGIPISQLYTWNQLNPSQHLAQVQSWSVAPIPIILSGTNTIFANIGKDYVLGNCPDFYKLKTAFVCTSEQDPAPGRVQALLDAAATAGLDVTSMQPVSQNCRY